MILTVVTYHAQGGKQHLCVHTYTQCVLAELELLRKDMLCYVDEALNTSLQCISSAKTAYKLFVIRRKEIKDKKKRKHQYMCYIYCINILLCTHHHEEELLD